MAKDRHSRYVPGLRTDRWLKVKIRPEQEVVAGGWVKGAGKAVDLGALLVGVYEDGALEKDPRRVIRERPKADAG